MLNLFFLFRACAYDLFSVHIFQHPYFSLHRLYTSFLYGVDVDYISTRRCTESRWDSLDGMTVCLVALVTSVLFADNRIVVAVLWVVQHNVSMTTSKNGRLILKWTLGSRERVENQPTIIRCAEHYQPFTNECAENYQPITNVVGRDTWVCWFFLLCFVQNNADVVVVHQKQHGRDSNIICIVSRRSRQDRLLTSWPLVCI